MWKRLHDRFITLPMQDAVKRRDALLLQSFLLSLFVAGGLALLTAVVVFGKVVITTENFLLGLSVMTVTFIAVVMLRYGHLRWPVGLVAAAILAAQTYLLLTTGLRGLGGALTVFIIPVSFVGLLLGRRALLLTSGLSVAAVLGGYLLEQRGTTLTPLLTTSRLLVFVSVIALLTFFLDRFSSAFREASLRSQHDIAERERAEKRLHFLLEASEVLASSLDYQTTLTNVAKLAVPHMATWCTVDVVREDGTLERLAITHQNPAKVAWAKELQQRYPPDPNAPTGVVKVIKTGQSELYPEIVDEMLVASAQDEAHLQILREIGFSSAMIVPLTTNGRTQGALSFVCAEPGDCYDQTDLALAEALARKAALALSHARLHRDVSEQRERFEVTLASIGDAVIATDARGRITFMNPVAETLTGWPQAEALGLALDEVFRIVNEYSRETVESPVAKVRREGTTVGLANHTVLLSKTGDEIPIDDSGAPIRDDERRITGVVLVFRDVSERKDAEEQRQYLADLLRDVSDAVISTDNDFRIRSWNPGAERIYGWTAEEMLGQRITELIQTEYLHEEEAQVRAAFAETGKWQGEVRQRHKDGTPRFILSSVSFTKNVLGEPTGAVAVNHDISERKQAEEALREARAELERQVVELERSKVQLESANTQLHHDAFHDDLTGLPNRALFLDRLDHTVKRYKRYPEKGFAVLFMDFDRFKVINDSLGHAVGDALLVAISQSLAGCVRPADTVARLGGDEFTILLEPTLHLDEAHLVAERLQQLLLHPFELGEHKVHISASIGIVFCDREHELPDDILRAADTAMYRAKALGKARYVVFTPAMQERAQLLMSLESDLRGALERDELLVYYQPVVTVENGQLVGFEALVRWQHPKHGLIAPAEFIPLAEETGLIIAIDRWVLMAACRQMRSWQQLFPHAPVLTLSVNLSGQQFLHDDLVSAVSQALRDTDFDPHHLRVEITESALMSHSHTVNGTLAKLKAAGIALHIDDFGTGYSSLSYLQRFPVDALKIDRSFIDAMLESSESLELVRAILVMAKNLRLNVVAEGVETTAQLAQLRALHCEHAQGYYFAKPLDVEQASAFVAQAGQHTRQTA